MAAGRPTARVGTLVGRGARARHRGGATDRARVSLLTGLRGGMVSDTDQGLARGPDTVTGPAVVALAEAVTEVAAAEATRHRHQLMAAKTSMVEHEN